MSQRSSTLIVSHHSVEVGQRTVGYTLRRNRRAKRITLRVDHCGLTMTVPWSFPHDQVGPFIRARSDWVMAMLARLAARPAPLADRAWSPTEGVRLLDQYYPVRFGDASQRDLLFSEKEIILPGHLAGDRSQAQACLERWLKEAARQYLTEQLARHGAKMGVSPNRVMLRSQKTRWGSCSSLGGISLNWRLIMAPPAVIDYILIHELAHLIEMNHSARFWQIVACHDPNYREHRLWLGKHGSELRL